MLLHKTEAMCYNHIDRNGILHRVLRFFVWPNMRSCSITLIARIYYPFMLGLLVWLEMAKLSSRVLTLVTRVSYIIDVIWGHVFGHGEVKWPPIGLKHWKVRQWSLYLSFDMSHDMGYTKVIVMVMDVIWGHVFGHGEVKWPPIGLKHWTAEYWSHYI